MAYRMFLARALQCPTKKAIGSFKLLHFEANVYYFFCCKLCSHVYQLLAYIKHFASFHYETISFPERNTLHAYTHTHSTYNLSLFIRCVRYDFLQHCRFSPLVLHIIFTFCCCSWCVVRSLTVFCLLPWIMCIICAFCKMCTRVYICLWCLYGYKSTICTYVCMYIWEFNTGVFFLHPTTNMNVNCSKWKRWETVPGMWWVCKMLYHLLWSSFAPIFALTHATFHFLSSHSPPTFVTTFAFFCAFFSTFANVKQFLIKIHC